MIAARQFPDVGRPSKSRGQAWIEQCMLDGRDYQVRSYSGAPYALARVLVAAGVPDQPMSVVSQGLAGETRYRSIANMAEQTIEENASRPVRAGRYQQMPESSGAGRAE